MIKAIVYPVIVALLKKFTMTSAILTATQQIANTITVPAILFRQIVLVPLTFTLIANAIKLAIMKNANTIKEIASSPIVHVENIYWRTEFVMRNAIPLIANGIRMIV